MFTYQDGFLCFHDPVSVISTNKVEQVIECLEYLETTSESKKLWFGGYVAYEAAPAFDPAFKVNRLYTLPLLWFGIYQNIKFLKKFEIPESWETGNWNPLITKEEYEKTLEQIKKHIASGDVYQINYTFPLETNFSGNALAWFLYLSQAQEGKYSAFINTEEFCVVSASPELFFELNKEFIRSKPMKGTRSRGLLLEDDKQQAIDLVSSEKDRAENVMIVDLVRNDLAKIAETGSVRVTGLFEIERYPTVWQMTSTIEARTQASLSSIFKALFPPGSVTGAPKIEMMKICSSLEPYPRGVYCGTIGWYAPSRKAQFNVAIRTAVIDTSKSIARYYVGSGITWDSAPQSEYEESLTKASILHIPHTQFNLIETILFENGVFFLLDEHLLRLGESAEYFGFAWNRDKIIKTLENSANSLPDNQKRWKMRLLLSKKGDVNIEISEAPKSYPVRIGYSNVQVDPNNVFLYHKTTNREIYKKAKESRPELDDVILTNTKGEITETTIANIIFETETGFYTPKVSCGLLPGVFRKLLLRRGTIKETILTKEDMKKAQKVWLINSVRKWYPAIFID